MNTSEKLDQILPALLKVKSELKAVTKGANNPFFKSKYADLNAYLEEVEPLLEKNGLILTQAPQYNTMTNVNVVETRIYHAVSGQWIGGSMKLVGETDMQKAGSAITYGRRYVLGGLLSMQAVDDDGNVASSKITKPTVTNTVKGTGSTVSVTSGSTTTVLAASPAGDAVTKPRASFRKDVAKTVAVDDGDI